MSVRYTDAALRHVASICAYIAERNEPASRRVVAAIAFAADSLSEFPFVGRQSTVPGVRVLIIRRFPYIISYHLDDDGVVILGVFHAAQDLRP